MVNNSLEIRNTSKSVVLGHPDILIGEGIASIIVKANYRVLGKANTEVSLKELTLKCKPDIILFEPVLSECCADIISEFRQQVPKSVVALVTKRGAFDGIAQAIEAGASGCISVDISPEEFIRSLQSLLAGDVLVSKDLTIDVRKQFVGNHKSKPIEKLSNREREVLLHISKGTSTPQIARKLFLSEDTVKSHVRNILYKLNLENRLQAAVYAVKEGLVTDINFENSENATHMKI